MEVSFPRLRYLNTKMKVKLRSKIKIFWFLWKNLFKMVPGDTMTFCQNSNKILLTRRENTVVNGVHFTFESTNIPL